MRQMDEEDEIRTSFTIRMLQSIAIRFYLTVNTIGDPKTGRIILLWNRSAEYDVEYKYDDEKGNPSSWF